MNREYFSSNHSKPLEPKNVYKLRHSCHVPEGGDPFWCEAAQSETGVRFTNDASKSKSFHGVYLNNTCWDWERHFEAVEA